MQHHQDGRQRSRGRAEDEGDVRSILYAGTGMNGFFGQALTAGQEWPRRNLSAFTRTINYDQRSLRDELNFAEPCSAASSRTRRSMATGPGTWVPTGRSRSRRPQEIGSSTSGSRRTAS